MDNVGHLVWSSDLALGEDGNALIARFLRKTCSLVEAEINEAGGIGGKKMKIHYKKHKHSNGSAVTFFNDYSRAKTYSLVSKRLDEQVETEIKIQNERFKVELKFE